MGKEQPKEERQSTVPMLISKSEYAAHRGVSPAMVTRWIKAGRIVLDASGKRVDVAASDAVLAASMDLTRGGRGGKPGAERSVAPGTAPFTETPLSRATSDDKEASTALKRLKLARESGAVVDRQAFERTNETTFAGLRDGLLGIPNRIGTRVAAETDARKVMDMIRGEIERELNTLADSLQGLADSAGATKQ